MRVVGEWSVRAECGPGKTTIGPLLRCLRGDMSLWEINCLSGIAGPYLSPIGRGHRTPGPPILKRMAALFGVGVHDLLRRAGHLEDGKEPRVDLALEVERTYQFVLADRRFLMAAKPKSPLSEETKRLIVEKYERLSGKRALD